MNYCNNPANFCSSLNSYSFLTRQTKDVNLVKLTRWEFVVWGKYPWPIYSVPLLLWDTYQNGPYYLSESITQENDNMNIEKNLFREKQSCI